MLKHLFQGNPLLLDLRRSVRRIFGIGKQGKVNLAVSTISALIYGLVLLVAWTNYESIDARVYVVLLCVVICLVVPAVTHGAIAGERERRSWDFLLVAPVSSAQIVAGKFLSGAGIVLLLAVAFSPMFLIAFFGHGQANFFTVLGMLIMVISYGFLLNAVSLYVSSRFRRAFGANLTIYGMQFAALLVLPILITILTQGQADTWAFFLHPFVVCAALSQDYGDASVQGQGLLTTGGGLIQAITYLVLSLALLGWTEATLRDLDRVDGGG